MDWLERLNRQQAAIPVEGGSFQPLSWAYTPHLADNVPHRHTFFEACLVGEWGRGTFFVQDRPERIAAGDLFIARPGVVHRIANDDAPEMELYWVCFQWLPGAASEAGEIGALMRAFAVSLTTSVEDEDRRILTLWKTLRAVSEGRPRPGQTAQVQSLMAALLLAIAHTGAGRLAPAAGETAGPDISDLNARAALLYINDNLYRPLSLPEVASHVHMSPRQLCRVIARFTGTSPAAYITRARLDRARGLLLKSSASIKEIAASLGYADVHYFTRLFSREFGCSPGAYRRRTEQAVVSIVQKEGALV